MKLFQITLIQVLLVLLGHSSTAIGQSSCNGHLAPNSINNGDFGAGTATFLANSSITAPDFLYFTAMPTIEGAFTISSSVNNNSNICWLNTSDNSSDPNGYMLIVNGSSTPSIIYDKTLEICDDINYQFSLDVLNLISPNCAIESSPTIELLINNQLIASTAALAQDGNWHELSGNYHTITGTNILNIQIRSIGILNSSNDFAIDNIRFQHCSSELTLPLTTTYCSENGAFLNPDISNVNYSNPYYQWQQSFDGGTSWQDMAGENAPTLYLNTPINNLHYRLQVGNGPVNFLSENCRSTSSATKIKAIIPTEVFLTPTICDGDTITLGNQTITVAGNYTTTIGGDTGCDSLIHSFVFVKPTYHQLFSINLCSGDVFEGQTYQSDTILQQFMTTDQGCDSIITTEIDVAENESLNIQGNTLLCSGESTNLVVSSGYINYVWSTGNTSNNIEISSEGNYAVTVINSQGCMITTDTNVEVSMPFFETQLSPTSCPDTEDGMVKISILGGGIDPYFFSIDDQDWIATDVFQNLTPGIHNISIQDAAGCEQSQEVEIIANNEILEASILGIPNETLDMGDTLQISIDPINTDFTYSWLGQGIIDCKDCPNTAWVPFHEGQLSLIITSAAGCSIQLDTLVALRDRYRIYFPNIFSPNGDGNNDTYSPGLDSNVKQVAKWEIYDRWGGRVYATSATSPNDPLLEWNGTWRGEVVEEGVYLYLAEIEFSNGRRKIFTGEVTLVR